MARLRERLLGATLVAASALVSLAGAELALRALGFSYPGFWVPDPVTGAVLRPRMAGWSRGEGEAYVRINSRGLRDVEHALEKPRDAYRVAVLGDSYAEALQVRVEDTFWWRLARRLDGCEFRPGRRVEAINFGVSGFGTAQELLTLRHRASRYSPDLVLLAFFPGNDVRNNSAALEPDRQRPFFLREGRLVLDDSFAAHPAFLASRRASEARAVLQDLRLYQLLRRVRAGAPRVHHNAPLAVALAGGAPATPRAEHGIDEEVFREPATAAWRQAWEVTERLLVALRDETAGRGARLVVAVLSSAGAVHPDAALRERYARSLGVPDLFYPERRLAAIGERHGIEVIALAPRMAEYAARTGIALHGFPNALPGFGHWNAAGHRLAAGLIAERLCPPQPSPQPVAAKP